MLTMKKALSICLIITGLSLYSIEFGLAEVNYIVSEGRPSATVILPDHPSDTENFAVQELILYIAKMSHALLPQQNESNKRLSSPVNIFVGRTDEAKRNGIAFQNSDIPDDAFKIITLGTSIFICGKGDRGTLYGVYEFLESHGVRWLMPGDAGEVVPRKTTIPFKQYQVTQAPAFRFRRFMRMATPRELRKSNSKWQMRMRLNSSLPELYQEKMGGTIGDGPLSHNYRRLIDKDSYNRHPEYFALIDGRRLDPRKKKQYWKMCVFWRLISRLKRVMTTRLKWVRR